MFRLADNGANISCTLTPPGSRGPSADTIEEAAQRDEFLSAADKAEGKGITHPGDVRGFPIFVPGCPRMGPMH